MMCNNLDTFVKFITDNKNNKDGRLVLDFPDGESLILQYDNSFETFIKRRNILSRVEGSRSSYYNTAFIINNHYDMSSANAITLVQEAAKHFKYSYMRLVESLAISLILKEYNPDEIFPIINITYFESDKKEKHSYIKFNRLINSIIFMEDIEEYANKYIGKKDLTFDINDYHIFGFMNMLEEMHEESATNDIKYDLFMKYKALFV